MALPERPIDESTVALRATAISQIEIDLSWTIGSNAALTSYIVERSTEGGAFTTLATLPFSARSYQSTGLKSNTAYTYRVRRTNGADPSNTAAANTMKYDAGLSAAFQMPSASTGTTRNILSYGATANNSANDDTTAINSAIAASSAGDKVLIPNGVFHLKTRDIRLKSGVSIVGQSQSGSIVSALFNDAGTDNPNSQVLHTTPGVGNLTISNLTLNMAGGQSMQYGLYLGSGTDGSTNCSRIAVHNVTIEGFEKFAIAVRHCDNILVQNCTMRNATALGGGGEGYGVMLGYDTTQNCWVNGNHLGPVLRHGVVIQYSAHHNLIENNVADSTTLDSFDLHGEDEYSNELRYNVAHDSSGGDGFGVGNTGSTHQNSGPNNWIHNNEVYNCRGGINIILGSSNEAIEDNYFHDNTDYGIHVYNGGGSNLVFMRNTILRSNTAADISEAPGLWMEGNVFNQNNGGALVTDSLTTGYTIINNDFRGNGAPILLGSSDGIFLNNLTQ